MAWELYISERANSEIEEIWLRGLDKYDLTIANDYDALIEHALEDLLEDPYRHGTRKVKGHDGIYSYHLSNSKARVEGNIQKPAHAVFYFTIENKYVAITSIARQSREHHIKSLNREEIIIEMGNK